MEKRIGLIFGLLMAFVFLLSFTSAATINATDMPNSINIQGTTGSFSFNVVSDANGTATLNIPAIHSQYGDGVITFSYPNSLNLSANAKSSVTVNYNVSDPNSYFNFFDSYSTTLNLNGPDSSSNSYTLNLQDSDFCEGVSNINNILTIDQPDFKLVNGYGDTDNWYLLNNMSASVDVQNNNNNYDLRNVKVEWALYTADGNKIDGDTLSTFSLNSGDDKTVKIDFQLDRNFKRIDDAGGNVYLYVKATGTVRDTSTNSNINGEKICSFNQNPSLSYVETGDDFVIPSDVTLNGNLVDSNSISTNTLSCDSTVNIAGNLYNIGNNDQDSGSYLLVYNQELGINKEIQIGSLNSFESQAFSTSFTIPKTAEEKTYQLQLRVYKDNNDIYENSQNDEAIKNIYFKVQGNCQIADPNVNVNLESSEVVSGKDMVVKVTVKNEDSKNATFSVSANGFSSWATLKTVDPENFILQPAEPKDVYLTFALKDSSAGDQQFNLLVTGNGDVLVNQPVSVTVQQGSALNNLFQNTNWELWGIIILNVILLIAIIIVARRVLKRR